MKRLIKKSFFGPNAVRLEDIEFIDEVYEDDGVIKVQFNEQGKSKAVEDSGGFKYHRELESDDVDTIAFIKWEVYSLENVVKNEFDGEFNPDYKDSMVLYVPFVEIEPAYQQSMIFKYLLDHFDEVAVQPILSKYNGNIYFHADFANQKLKSFIDRMSSGAKLQWVEDNISDIITQ